MTSEKVDRGTVKADAVTDTTLTAGRVVIVGTGGILADDADLTFSTATLTATNIAGNGAAVTAVNAATVAALDTTSATCSVALLEGATGAQAVKSDAGISYNAATGALSSTSVVTPAITTASGALTVTPAAGSGVNLALSTTGDFAINTDGLVYDTSTEMLGLGVVPSQKVNIQSGALRFDYVAAPSGAAVTFADGAAGVNTTGVHSLKFTAVNAIGETELGTASPNYTVATNEQKVVSNCPLSSDPTVTSRNVYSCKAGGSTWYLIAGLLPDNTTTSCTINVADASLTTAGPSLNNTSGRVFTGTICGLAFDSAGGCYIGGNGTLANPSTGATIIHAGTAGTIYLKTNTSSAYYGVVNAYGIGIGFAPPVSGENIAMLGTAAAKITMKRHATADTAGNTLSLVGGGCTASATNKNGGMVYLIPGVTTGSGMASVRTQRYSRDAAATTDNTSYDAVIVTSEKTLVHATATGLIDVAVATESGVGGHIDYTIVATNGTDCQAFSGTVNYSAVHKAAAIVTAIADDAVGMAYAESDASLTLTVAWTNVDDHANSKVTIKCAATSNLTGTPVYKMYYTVHNGSLAAVTQL